MNNFSDANLKSIAEKILQDAKKKGATAAEVTISADDGFNVAVRLGEVETVEYHQDQDVSIVVYFGHQQGNATTTDLQPASIEATLEAACSIAKLTGEDPCNGLADKELLATKFPDLDLYHPWDISTEKAVELALQCEAIARNDQRITNSDGVTVSSFKGNVIYANSHGFLASQNGSMHDIACVLIAEKNGQMERDYAFTVARNASDLKSIEWVANEAVQHTVKRLGARKLKTTKAPILFVPEVARGIWKHFLSAISGGSLYRKTSFLLDHIEKRVFPDFITLEEDPFLLKGFGSANFDSDGVATRRQDFVKDGILERYLLSHYSAKRLGLQTTGNADGVHNLFVSHSDLDFNAMLKKMQRGLIVTEVMGQGVNILTGDYSRGAAGFWVENGEVQYPVSEVTIAGNLRDMFMKILAVGSDIDYRGNILTGSVLIEEMTIAGE